MMSHQALAFALLTLSFCCFCKATAMEAQSGAKEKKGKFLSVFQIIQFPNDSCIGDSNKNGTCYTESECSAKGGTNAGSCADGFGVCCTQTLGCGDVTNENSTYFDSDATTISGGCSATVCPCNDNICQLRLDFSRFVITGPSTTTASAFKIANGVASPTGTGFSVSLASNCLTDTFAVTNPGGSTPSTICGTNTGEHMYVDSSPSCNALTFQLGELPSGVVAIASRSWSIKVTQYSCDYSNLAPQGCTQYFFGVQATGTVQSYNYNGGNGQHLANQDQAICIRRESQYCRICFTTTTVTDFDISGDQATNAATRTGYNNDNACCGYTSAGPTNPDQVGFDCVMIPGAAKEAMASAMVGSNFCGRFGLVTSATVTSGLGSTTVCSTLTPFLIRFRSDGFEYADGDPASEAYQMDAGFTVTYTMDADCNLPANAGRR